MSIKNLFIGFISLLKRLTGHSGAPKIKTKQQLIDLLQKLECDAQRAPATITTSSPVFSPWDSKQRQNGWHVSEGGPGTSDTSYGYRGLIERGASVVKSDPAIYDEIINEQLRAGRALSTDGDESAPPYGEGNPIDLPPPEEAQSIYLECGRILRPVNPPTPAH